MTSVRKLLQSATTLLHKGRDTARMDAEILLAHVLQQSRTWLHTWPEYLVAPACIHAFNQLLEKRKNGEPIAYLTGQKEFWSLMLHVTQDTLIPRPETEMLVELTLDLLKDKADACLLDAGTGSGAIALALAHEKPHWDISACDSSEAALQVARDNAERLQLETIHFYQSDWFSALPSHKKYHAILSNPPYIAENDPHLGEGDLRFEPKQALRSPQAGYQDLEHLIAKAPAFLEDGGLLLLEHGYNQRERVAAAFHQQGYTKVISWPDYQGLDRISAGIWHS